MGNIINSFFSGFGHVIGNLFGTPMDFLSGKSCNSTCGSTWDLICYIENFCIAHLLKMLTVLVLFYFVLLFFYLLHKTGICYCIGKSLCKIVWGCFAVCFHTCEYGCSCMCYNIRKLTRTRKRRRRAYDFQDYTTSDDETMTYSHSRPTTSCRSRKPRKSHLEMSLRPRSHRISIGISRNTNQRADLSRVKNQKHLSTVHNIKVTKTSKFVRKGSINNIIYRHPRTR
ncbi:hypothetical protein ACHQM5_022872 [Ranunculus cassubicifolius]